MSHSPLQADSESDKSEYRRRWTALVQLMREGRSLSGRERNCCFLNTGGQPFADVSAATGLDFPEDARAVLPTDWDFDGRLDMWLIGRTAPRVRFLRNQSATSNHFVSVRLTGVRCNRDAIGARVEVSLAARGEQPLVKTLRAGDGFVSQSSKTLHFGLGDATSIEWLSVRWPDGELQRFDDLAVDAFYDITQGGDAPVRWMPPTDATRLEPAKIEPLPREGTVRVALARGIPMPVLKYKDAQGRTATLAYDGERATLINLWATWCRPCLGELKEFADREAALRDGRVRIIALNVDGLRDSSGPAHDAARRMLDQLAFPFERGDATDSLVSKLEFIQHQFVAGGPALLLPTSFLVGPDGSLAAIFQGPVPVDRLLADAERLSADEAAATGLGGMFPGQWVERPNYLEPLVRLGAGFLANGDYDDAARYYRAVLDIDPNVELARDGLREAQDTLSQIDQAVARFSAVLSAQPNDARAHWQLGLALQSQGNIEQALVHLQRAVQIDPGLVRARSDLGAALASQGEFDQAEQQFNLALEMDPADETAKENLRRFQLKNSAQTKEAAPTAGGL